MVNHGELERKLVIKYIIRCSNSFSMDILKYKEQFLKKGIKSSRRYSRKFLTFLETRTKKLDSWGHRGSTMWCRVFLRKQEKGVKKEGSCPSLILGHPIWTCLTFSTRFERRAYRFSVLPRCDSFPKWPRDFRPRRTGAETHESTCLRP